VTISHLVIEIEDATDPGDARDQALEQAEVEVEEIEEEEADDDE